MVSNLEFEGLQLSFSHVHLHLYFKLDMCLLCFLYVLSLQNQKSRYIGFNQFVAKHLIMDITNIYATMHRRKNQTNEDGMGTLNLHILWIFDGFFNSWNMSQPENYITIIVGTKTTYAWSMYKNQCIKKARLNTIKGQRKRNSYSMRMMSNIPNLLRCNSRKQVNEIRNMLRSCPW